MTNNNNNDAALKITTTSGETLNLAAWPKWVCPKCGWETVDSPGFHGGIIVSIPDFPELNARYCLACFARWLRDTLPALERKIEDKNAE